MQTSYPRARTRNVNTARLNGEIVITDLVNADAHLLNRSAALVWQACDGNRSVSQIAAHVSSQLGSPVDEKFVWYTLEQLSTKNLLEQPAALPARAKGLTRRDMLRAGLVGAAVVLPVIVTMTAPKPTHAQSCLAGGQLCSVNSDCCSNQCSGVCL